MPNTRTRLLTGLLVGLNFLLFEAATAQPSTPRSGLRIQSSIEFSSGTYTLNEPIRIEANDAIIDFGGAILRGTNSDGNPDGYTGRAIEITGSKNVTLKNVKTHGFKVAIYAQDCIDLTISHCDVSRNFRQHLKSTPRREANSDWLWPHYNDKNEWMSQYGGGIVLDRCRGGVLSDNVGYDSQNGIILSRTEGAQVYDNDMSYQSGWGLAMWRSSRNEISRNRFDYCVRGYSHGVYSRGQDSSGILVFEQCNENLFLENSATHGGDGFFLYAGHETLKKTGKGGCNDNRVIGNDFSHAVANGIEATFSSGNVFAGNRLDECDYGVWAGYSFENSFLDNEISRSLTAGIAIEHGHDNWIEGNVFSDNRRGIWLWWDYDEEFLTGVYGQNRDTESHDYDILRNRFVKGALGVELAVTSKVKISQNEFTELDLVFRLGEQCKGIEIRENHLLGNRALLENKSDPITLGHNSFGSAPTTDDAQDEKPSGAGERSSESILPRKPFPIDFDHRERRVVRPSARGKKDPFLPKTAIRGRETMIVDEWGPVDASKPRLLPETVSGWGSTQIRLLGSKTRFKVVSQTDGLHVRPSEGTTPAILTLSIPEGRSLDFELGIETAGTLLKAHGSLIHARWDVRVFGWKSVGIGKPPGNWREILEGEPLHREMRERLDFNWGGGPVSAGLPQNHFATVSETEVELEGGTYELDTVSDDGIRVLVDGKTVLEDWTWHPPKSIRAEIKLAPGRHKIRVEHFEIDGHAQLQVGLARIR